MDNEQKKTNRNPGSKLFKGLTRLLSGPIIQRRQQNYRRERRLDLNKYKFTSASGQNFKKYSKDPFVGMTVKFISEQNRAERYGDFDQMEYEPIIASALDIYADEMTTSSALEEMLNIKCRNEEIKGILYNLYHNIMNIEFNLFGWCRSMCKYGDFFLYLDMDENLGITNTVGLPSHELEKMEGLDESNPNYIQYQWNSAGLTLENWQIAHFRILGNDKYAPYGTSILEPSRRIWRQLILLEDAMMAYRIVRSPERRVFKIDVGNIPPNDVEQYMQKVMTSMKRSQVIDQDTGRVDLRYNPLSVEEDYFIPVRGGQGSDISSLPGGTYTGDIDDVKYLQNKLFAALKIPPSYLARTSDAASEDKTTLAQKDIRFARTIQRLQRSVISELEKIGIVHLYTLGFRDDDLISFKLSLNNPSKIAELQELEHWNTKFSVASAATEGFFSKRWIATKLFAMNDEEFVRNQREMFYDRKFDTALEQAAEAATEGGAEFGGELGGDLDLGGELGDEELGGELGGEELGGEEMGGEETAILAAPPEATPGKRDVKPRKFVNKDGETTTDKSKGNWYKPVEPDQDKRKTSGPRKKHYMAQYSRETGKATKRNIFKGLSPGAKEILGLGKGLNENTQHNYTKEEENNLFKIREQVEDLVSNLEIEKK
mgnify:FL=1